MKPPSTDVIILLMPVKIAWDLHASTKKKLCVVLVFAVGFMYASTIAQSLNPVRRQCWLMLTLNSAPIFSLVGVIARVQASKSPDVTFNELKIGFWA